MTIKPNTFYKEMHTDDSGGFYIIYTSDKEVLEYGIQADETEEPVIFQDYISNTLGTIKIWQKHINNHQVELIEIDKDDLFLELL